MLCRTTLIRVVALTTVSFAALVAAQSGVKPHAKVIALEKADSGILSIVSGPPETITMKSGYVVLEPGHSVGKHSTEHHEEMLVVLEGRGEMLFHDGSKLQVKERTALYCPPETEHDVKNTGTSVLRYVYIVADAR